MALLTRLFAGLAVCLAASAAWADPCPLPPAGLPVDEVTQICTGPLEPYAGPEMQLVSEPAPAEMGMAYVNVQPQTAIGSSGNGPLQLNAELKNVKVLEPPAPITPTTISSAAYVDPYYSTSTFPSPNQGGTPTLGAAPQIPAKVSTVVSPVIQGIGLSYSPGGISLSKAAAERLALDINIEGVGYRDGRVVLAGPHDDSTRIDAGLFMTALRLACGPSDPYFSLDPINGAAWAKQANEASKIAWERLKGAFGSRPSNRFAIETISVNQRYPALWSELFAQFPELRTKLVFRPNWLSQTRFGEILYKADVLLKELSTGTSVVDPKLALRANAVNGYAPPDQRRAVRGFLTADTAGGLATFNTNRMWFDLLPDAAPEQKQPMLESSSIERDKVPGLYTELSRRGLIGGPIMEPISKAILVTDGPITDLSQVYPKMFVRRHDYATGKDIAAVDPELDRLAHDVDDRFKDYSNAYSELRDLSDVFRAYVASVSLIKQAPEACRAAGSPLSDGERISAPLPDSRPSELALTVAQYTSSDRWWLITGSSVSGGISLRGKQFYSGATSQKRTQLTSEMAQLVLADIPAQRWVDVASGREYVAFSLESPPPRAPIMADKLAN
jgi:hypothetical protein